MPQRSAASNQQALDKLTAAISSFRLAGHPWGEALALSKVGQLYQRATDMTRARATLAEALALARAIEDDGSKESVSSRLARPSRVARTPARAGVLRTGARDLRARRSGRPGHRPHECRHRVERPARVSDCGGRLRPGAAARLECRRSRAGRTHPQQPWRHAPSDRRRAACPGALPESASPQSVHRQRSARVDGHQQHRDRLQAVGRLSTSARSYTQSLELVRTLGNPSNEAQLLNNIGNIQKAEGQPDESLESFDQALSIFRRLEARPGEAMVLNNIAAPPTISWASIKKALNLHLQSHEVRKAAGDRRGDSSSLNNAGLAWHKLREPARGARVSA